MALVSVILCTHNPRPEPLNSVLASLREQTLPRQEWEFCLIDNGSKPAVATKVDLSWHEKARHIREEQLGLTWARLRGIRDSRGDILVFVDDDNVLAPNYLERAVEIHRRFPHLGAWGAGQLTPRFETRPPAAVEPLLSMLALRDVSTAVWSSNPRDWSCIPWGAGLCVSREISDAYIDLLSELGVHEMFGRRGSQQRLWQGDDELFSFAAVGRGLGFGIFPELRVTHLIAARRVTKEYFIKLLHDHAVSHALLRFLLFGDRPARPTFAATARVLAHGLRRGRFSMRCRWAALRGTGHAADFISANRLEYRNPLQASTTAAAVVRDRTPITAA